MVSIGEGLSLSSALVHTQHSRILSMFLALLQLKQQQKQLLSVQKSLQNHSQPTLHAKGLTIKTHWDIINRNILFHLGHTQKGQSAAYRCKKWAAVPNPSHLASAFAAGSEAVPKLLDGVQHAPS